MHQQLQFLAQQAVALQSFLAGQHHAGLSDSKQSMPRLSSSSRPFLLNRSRPLPFASLTTSAAPCCGSKSASAAVLMTGTWVKDKKRSDSMEQAMDIMQLNGLVRQAVKLVRGIQLTHSQTEFTMAVFSVFAWFKVTERYTLDGKTPSQCRRRDLRKGRHVGTAAEVGKKVVLSLAWQAPLGGSGTDTFHLVSPEELHVHSELTVPERGKAKYTTVYTRK